MSDKSKIEWLNGGASWNPITGCDPISEGCANCYAACMAPRLAGRFGYPDKDPFRVTFHQDKLYQPVRWKQSRMIFVCSMGDLFHEEVSVEWIDYVFSIMAIASQHTYIILTKRPQLLKQYYRHIACATPKKNIWLGVTAENQARAEERIPVLLEIPAVKHFVSIEPMLGEVRLDNLSLISKALSLDGFCHTFRANKNALSRGGMGLLPRQWSRLDWVVCGAETGSKKRPMQNIWAESLKEQCETAGVPFFFKKDSIGNGHLNGTIYHNYPTDNENIRCQAVE